ncbi:hypothetical protein GCM10022255_102280 [Dactylosporangium darangshiense]|uniref:DUF4132 domain-containing protein n=1 Tax=Dactylosporangium darangshiense TaxID=579108 RepID=A0ABP8DSH2_9ACTN
MGETTWTRLLPPADDRFAAIVAATPPYAPHIDPAGWDDERRRAAALRVHADAVDDLGPPTSGYSNVMAALHELGAGGLAWSRDELVWCLHRLTGAMLYDGEAFRVPGVVAAALDAEALDGLADALRAVLAAVNRRGINAIPVAARTEIAALYGAAIARATADPIPGDLLHAGDSFGPAARRDLRAELAVPGVADALLHAVTLSRPVPPAGWTATAARLLPPARAAVRGILERYSRYHGYLHDSTDRLVRGLTCMLALDDAAETTALVGAVARAAGSAHPKSLGFPRAPRTAAAAVHILAGRGGDEPVRVLAALSLTVKNKALLGRVQEALQRLGALRGWDPGQAAELSVDDHGLDRDRRRRFAHEDYAIVLEIAEDKPRIRYERAGAPLRSAPAAVRGTPALAEAQELRKRVAATLAAEKGRVEGLLSQGGDWDPADWARRYLEHPVTGVYGRRLIWTAGGAAGLPERRDGAWVLLDPAGEPAEATPSARIALWSPLAARPGDVAAWRDHVAGSGLRQPFKQAYRESYIVTPAEEQAGERSMRFAGHVLRYRQASALMRARGWQATYLGTWSSGADTDATKVFGAGRWRATFEHESAGDVVAPRYDVEFCTAGTVAFDRRDGALWARTALADVPPAVFSEAMRDVDLFVGVTSIGTDDAWPVRFAERRERAGFRDLTPIAEVRREALARIVPRLRIAERCELQQRYLCVRGKLRAYRIHLGSGNILMEPGDTYLCIVAAPGRATGTIHLPFDDDPMLSLILSKALLLAADDTITDPDIRRQIGSAGGRGA